MTPRDFDHRVEPGVVFEQPAPALLGDPADPGPGQRATQEQYRGNCAQDIPHRSEPDHE